ncbi:microtubule organization protein AKNA isoform X1 [Thunnus maccoyii]|uniref:microtubule organization protein AKNA isoform X1 n=1 Tax=Thunnus maccoyii TaxID=8240 RepID=UPI001C4B0060|nr:microtubule organization protein AKNA isoform X1 [Thunnus maccoyii]XP_042251628.1 microtubule organization protein AKNA isoform X1 [Thunnus maccoyii]XP_042251629.1 microtubule organization protein AKNA isoform X1 [Thunnus maccoyii]
MEIKKSTTAGVMFWTPAPVRTSPTSSVVSEDVWEDEDDEQAEKADDFVSQMDENGIIGLAEALEDVRLEETCDLDAECNPAWYLRALTPEEADPSGREMDTPPEELSYNLSEHLSHTESPGEDVQVLSPLGDDTVGILRARTEDEEVRQRKEQQYLLERDEYLDMTEEEKDGEEEVKRGYRNKKKIEHISTSGEVRATTGLAGSYINKRENEKISWTQSCSAHLPAVEPAVSNHHCPVYQSTSPLTSSTLPHLLHFTAEEIASAPGIEAETLPDIGFTESLPESHSSCMSLKSSPRCPRKSERGELKGLQPAAVFTEPNQYSGVSNGPLKSDKPTPSPRKMRQHSPEATYSRTHALSPLRADCSKSSPNGELNTPRVRTNADLLNESRSGALSHRTPDFSKVEPRVRFPKGGYKPPKSKRSSKMESLSPQPPLVFKSPADIVKEVLLNTTDGPPAPSDCNRPPASAPNSTVPQDFRCRQQATTLLEQLQEDYNRLLTKYAEAENTIDRLRLEAKVNLYSDPPKPGHSVQSGLNKEASKFMTLDFPQAQRADTNSASLHPDRHSPHQRSSAARPSSSASISSTRSPGPQVGQQLTKILYNQADKFLQQLQTFEDLLNSEKLKPFEQMKGLSQLVQGLDSLERGYLLARDEHKLLQQRGTEISHFDPERELDGLIFQCGLRMDELKEQVEQMRQEQPICEPPPSPPLQPATSSVPSEGREPLSHPQSPAVPLLVDPGEAAVAEVSSVSEEEEEDEETLNSVFLKPLNGKHRRVDQEFTTLIDHYQSFKELPRLLDCGLREGAPLSAASRTDLQPGEKGKEGQVQGTGNMEVQRSLPQRQAESDHQDSPSIPSSKQRTSKSNLPSCRASSQSTTLPVHPPSSNRRLEMGKSHSSSLSSLGEITVSDRRSSKLQTGTRRVLSQDGIISPETDSGFVGSESSHPTPAAAPSPLHQRASESVSVPQEVNSGKPQTGPVSAPPRASSPSHRRTALEPSRGSRRRTRHVERRRTFSCSPQRWVSQTDQTRADSGTSEFGLESDCIHTVSEEGQSDQYTESIDSFHSSSPSSSPAARCHHGDSLTALSSSQVANRNDAIQTLQAEVTRLKDQIESCLKNKKPVSSVRAAQDSCTHQNTSTPHIRSAECRRDVSGGGRERWTVDEAEESTLRRTARKKSAPAHRQKPQADILTGSQLEPSTPRPQPQVSRCTQTSEAAPDSRCSRSSRTHPRQDPGVSVQVSEAADEPDSRRGRAPLCPQCLSCHRGRSEKPVGGNKESTHSPSRLRHCPLCGRLEPYRSTEPDCRRDSDSPTRTNRKPAKSLDRTARCRYFAAAAPPALLQCTPVCPPPLLLYSGPVMNSYQPPLYVSPSNSTGTSSGIRGRKEVRGRTRRSLSVDTQRSMDSSLNRAIRAAQHMKHTSRHMARSLAAGLHYQELLSQSCSY